MTSHRVGRTAPSRQADDRQVNDRPADDRHTDDRYAATGAGAGRPGMPSAAVSPEQAIVGALDELDEGLLVFQGERVLSASDAFCRIVGRGRDELLEMTSILDLAAPERREALGERLQRHLRGEVVSDHVDTTLLAADGRRHDVELAIKATQRAGLDTVFVAVVRDTTFLRREARFARMLADGSEIVAGGPDDLEAMRAIVRLVVPDIADWCAFDVQDLDGSLARRAVAHVNVDGEALLWELDRRFPVRRFEGNLRARVLRSGTPLVMNGITDATIRATARNSEHAEMLRRLGMGAAMWVPATSLGQTLGVMSLGRAADDRPFDDADLDIVSKLGHRTAQAIERSTADRTIRARERQQAAAAELGRLALVGLALPALHQEATRLLADTLEVEYSSALELKPDGESLRLVSGVGESAAGQDNDPLTVYSAPEAGYTIRSGGPVLVEDLRTETRFGVTGFRANLGIVSGLSVVITSRDERPYGVLSVHTKRRRRFDGDDVNFVQAMANVLTTAIERRESEVALRESDERLHLALAASQTGTWEWHLRSGELQWSEEILRLHGLPITQRPPTFDGYLQMIHPDDRELFQRTVGAALHGSAYDLDYRLVLPDGSVRWANGTGRVFADAAGAPVRMVGTGRDITDRKETEQERDRLLEQERTARELREAFIGVLSHELRTPITTILGGSRLLSERLTRLSTEATLDLLNDVGQEAERLSRLIEDLLILTRAERGNIDSRDDPVLPSMVVDTVVSSSDDAQQRVTLDVRIPRNLPIVAGDETYLEQILRNLIGNAAKFSPAGSTVIVSAEVTPTEVVLRVLDDGPGIEPGEADRLFEVFYRSPTTKSKAAGSGIGLFVARQLTAAMGGRIWAQQRPEGGAEFGIALRRYEIPAEEADADADPPDDGSDEPA